MPVRRAHLLIIPLNDRAWGIRVRNTVYGQFATYAAASEHAIQWGRRMAAKGVVARVLAFARGEHPHVVWTSEFPEVLLGVEFNTGPSKDALVQPRDRRSTRGSAARREPAIRQLSQDQDRAYDDAVSEGWPDHGTPLRRAP